MKRGDIGLLSIGIKRRFNPIIGIGPSQENIVEVESLLKILAEEKKVQKFIDSLQPGDIIYWKDLDVIELAWFEVKFLEVFDIERRELRIQEIHSFKQSVKLISAYDYLSGSLLTKEEYVNLCTKFADKRGNLQINYYFDTPRFTLKASEIGLRVRKSDKYVMTLKRKKGYALQEINETISEEVFQQFLKDGIIPVEEIGNELEDVLKGQKVINYMSLSTFRIGFPYKKGNIAIDKCKYVDTVDYELEYEATSYEGGKREFVEIVREFGIVYKKSKPKIKRAYDALKKKI